jgi:uncharacterized protein with PQ loop repeat
MGILVLGWIAAAGGAAVGLPQLWRIWKTRVTAGVSLLLWQLAFCTSIGWSLHGIHWGRANMIVPNVIGVVTAGTLLLALRHQRRLNWWRVFGPAALVGVTLGVLDSYIPGTVFGLLCLVPSLTGQAFQARSLLWQADIRGVSLAYIAVNLAVQGLWFEWGRMVHDPANTWCSGLIGVALAINLGLYTIRRTGVIAVPATATATATT